MISISITSVLVKGNEKLNTNFFFLAVNNEQAQNIFYENRVFFKRQYHEPHFLTHKILLPVMVWRKRIFGKLHSSSFYALKFKVIIV